MPKRKRHIDDTERMAYREAGHAVLATYFRIPFVHFGISTTFPPRPISRYSRIDQFCHLKPDRIADWPRVEKYISFLLSGSVCDMLFIEQHRQLPRHGKALKRFRNEWYRQVLAEPDPRTELAYVSLIAWLPAEFPSSVDQECQRLWDQSLRKLEYPPFWPAVETLARRIIMDGELIDEEAVLELIHREGELGPPEP